MEKHIGLLTAGGDAPGLNAAIRGIGKTAASLGMDVIGFKDGFRGLMENRFIRFENEHLSGILTQGGTILGTSRDKPHKMTLGECNGKRWIVSLGYAGFGRQKIHTYEK